MNTNHLDGRVGTVWTRRLMAATLALSISLAAGLAPADTHLGQQPDDHVILTFWSFGSGGFCSAGQGSETLFVERIMPDASAVPFTIPKGKRLIVTDFNLKTYVGGLFTRTATVNALLRLVNLGKGKGGHIVYDHDFHLVEDHDTINLTMEGQSLAGISVGADAALCPEISYDDGSVGKKRLLVTSGNYRGYLIDDAPAQDPTGGGGGDDDSMTRLQATDSTDLYETLR